MATKPDKLSKINHYRGNLLSATAPQRHVRTRRLVISTVSSLAAKAILLLVNLISIPILVRYLGTEQFGVWVTLSTALTLLLTIDLGVSNSVTNCISEAFAQNDQVSAARYSTTALVIMSSVSLVLGLIAWAIWPWLNWETLFHLAWPAEATLVSHAAIGALGIFLIGMPASLAAKVLGGYQELGIANVFAAAGGLLSLITTVVLVWMHSGLVALTIASCGALVAMNAASLLWTWAYHKPWLRPRFDHFTPTVARKLMGTGWKFFVLQTSGLLAWGSDNFIITHFLGPVKVVPYNVTWRVAGYGMALQMLLIPSLWPAYSEAFTCGDLGWVRRTFVRAMWLTMGSALAFAFVFGLCGRWIIGIWASQAAVPSETLLLLMCIWIVICTLMNNTALILVAKGDITLQVWSSFSAALINLVISIYLVRRIGASGAIVGTIMSYLLILVFPQNWKVWQILTRNKASPTDAEYASLGGE